MELAKVAVALRPRSAWESLDLGLGMLQQWWRPLYASFAAVYLPLAAACLAIGWLSGHLWLALVLLWWLKPVYDRVALHVVSRAVFGEVSGLRSTLAQARAWLYTGLVGALTFGRLDTARSFHLPVAQLEAQRGRAARERRALLGRRTLLEGWDIEVGLRRIAERHAGGARGLAAAAALLLASALLALAPAAPAQAQAAAQVAAKDPRREIAEVLKGPEFPHTREILRWQRRASDDIDTRERKRRDLDWLLGIGYALGKVSQALLWIGAALLIAYALWWAARMMPREPEPLREAYRPPPSLFGMELAPETLPADLPGAVRALLAAGRVREALGLLYRATLSALVHGRGIELRASDTEGEALERVRAHGEAATAQYFDLLVVHWQGAAYARRLPQAAEVERLLQAYAERFAAPGRP